MALPSGLPENVADDEPLACFVTHSRDFGAAGIKPSALMPYVKDRERSVFRQSPSPRDTLWAIGRRHLPKIYGAACVSARQVRAILLQVNASEPPDRHAAIVGWPWPEEAADWKARQKDLAHRLLQVAEQAMIDSPL